MTFLEGLQAALGHWMQLSLWSVKAVGGTEELLLWLPPVLVTS